MTEDGIPELDGDILYDCVNQLHSRLQKLLATGQSIHARYPTVLARLFTPEQISVVVEVAEVTAARLAVVNQRRKDIDVT